MAVLIDGQRLFGDEQMQIEVGSVRRDSLERTVPGVDGVLSVDLGGRGRKIRQSGVLRASSRSQLAEKAEAIRAFIDGQVHTLTADGQTYENVRMDSFEMKNERTSGGSVTADYRIVYTQLVQ